MNPTARRARTALIDATVIATLIDQALHALELGQPGLPEQTPGASPLSASGIRECRHPDCANSTPCPIHDLDEDPDAYGPIETQWGHQPANKTTPTERLAMQSDQASRDLDALTEHIRQAAHHLAKAAPITHRWGLKGVTDTEVTTGLTERLTDIWCKNCAKAGISTVHRIGRTECAFCEQFRLAGACGVRNPNNHPAPKQLLDIHFSRRINSGDITRTMTATYGPSWNKKLNKKGRKAA